MRKNGADLRGMTFWGLASLEGSAHQDGGAEDGGGERGYDFEAVFFEHGGGAVGGLVAEGAGLPAGDRIGFDLAAAFFLDAGEGGF